MLTITLPNCSPPLSHAAHHHSPKLLTITLPLRYALCLELSVESRSCDSLANQLRPRVSARLTVNIALRRGRDYIGDLCEDLDPGWVLKVTGISNHGIHHSGEVEDGC